MPKILVTGSRGLIGREVVNSLRERGDTVLEMDLRAPSPADIRDFRALRKFLHFNSGERVSGIIHLAAVSRVAWGEHSPELTNEINVGATKTIIEEIMTLSNPPWLLLASSREIYGNAKNTPVHEDSSPAPLNNYARSKVEAEALVEASRVSGLCTGIIRFSNVYGTEYDHPDRALPALLWRAKQLNRIEITGRDTFFDFVHVADCVKGVLAMIERLESGSSQLPPVHLASGRATSLFELATLAVQITKSDSEIIVLPPRPFDTEGFCGDPARAKALLGWEAAINVKEGMQLLLKRFQVLGHGPCPVNLPMLQLGEHLSPP